MTSMLRDVITLGHRHARPCRSAARTSPARPAPPTRTSTPGSAASTRRSSAWRGSASTSRKTLGANETGGVAALPIWISFMQKALKGVPEKPLHAARRRDQRARQSPTRACATTASNVSEYFFAEFPPRRPRATVWRRRRPAARRRTCATSSSRTSRVGHRGSIAGTRSSVPSPMPRRAQSRSRIAQAAARLIAEHGITDWSLAKRKAARAAHAARARSPAGRRRNRTPRWPSTTRCSAATRTRDKLARAARGSAALDAPACAVRAAPGRRRRGRLGHRAQRHSARARRRRTRSSVELALLNARRHLSGHGSDRDGAAELFVDARRRRLAPVGAHARSRRGSGRGGTAHGQEESSADRADEVRGFSLSRTSATWPHRARNT